MLQSIRPLSSANARGMESEDPKTLPGLLLRAANLWPENGIYFKDQGWDQESTFMSYADIVKEVQINAAKLLAHGTVTRGQCTVVYFDTHRENVIWFWSTVMAGGVPVMLSPLSSNETTLVGELNNVIKLFGGPTVLTTKRLAKLFILHEALITVTVEVVAGVSVEGGIATPAPDEKTGDEEELAMVLFTSGSTGFAKGIEYSGAQLVVSSRLKAKFHNMDSSKTFMSWVSFDHSAALCENHLHALYAGANQVMIPAIDFVQSPGRFWRALSEHRIAYTFAPNFFIAAAARAMNEMDVAERKLLDLNFSELRVIMCGGEANKTATLEAAEKILTHFGAPKCCIKASYGLSETCSALFYNLESPAYDVERNYMFASAGKHLPDHELRITDETGKPVKRNEQGAIQIRGPLIFKRYFNNESATSACMTKDGWFDTGDLGVLDAEGNLNIVGRSKEVLIINGQNYSSFELEHAIESANIAGLNKSFTASFSTWIENVQSDSEEVVILFNPTNDSVEDTIELRNTIAQINQAAIRFCRTRPAMVIPLPRQMLPKSTIGKLSRAKLKKSFTAGHFDKFKLQERLPQSMTQQGTKLTTPLQKVLATVLCEETGLAESNLHLEINLADLNIDSLGYLRIKSSLETILDREEAISMSLLLSCRTIADMDTMLLSIGTTTTEYDPIVPLVATGSKCPIILCHPGGGEFLTWLTLLKYIPDRPVYALRVRGFHKNETPFETLDEMLDIYMEGIRKHQPNGPYILLGLCFGGMLAFELGKRFEAAGDEVAFCGGIDNPADLSRIQVRSNARNFIIDLLHFFQLLDMETAMRWEEEMESVPDHLFTKEIFARFPDGTLENLDLSVPKVETWQRINSNMQKITRSYVPTGSVSKYDLFWVPPLPHYSCTDEEWRHDWLAKWKNHVTGASQKDVDVEKSEGPLRYHRVNGTHFTILRLENVEVFQRALNAASFACYLKKASVAAISTSPSKQENMKTNAVALSALTLATVTVALPLASEPNDQPNPNASRLSAAPIGWPFTNPFLVKPAANVPASLQPVLVNPLTDNLLGGILGNIPGGSTEDAPAKLLAAIANVNPFAGFLANTLANTLTTILTGLPVPPVASNPLDSLLPSALENIVQGLPSALNAANPLNGVFPSALADFAQSLPSAINAANSLNNILPSALAEIAESVPSAISVANSINGLFPSVVIDIAQGLPSAISAANSINGLIPSAVADIAQSLPSVISAANPLASILPDLAALPSAINAANPLGALLPTVVTPIPAVVTPTPPAPVLPVVVPTTRPVQILPAFPQLPVASVAAVTPVAIPTTILREVPALVPSTFVTSVATVVPTNVVAAIPTNILGLLQPILPPKGP
ncbi:hypothetical protein OPT61_g3649 [Boeremia exigua]|uniref:Uncharacterized protein n=1 Tax=Boeremia exigua TaxID=749465 RepID=A0ACC2IH33_9PLEO|nr:hypothetical protein OPT61_g3649 [Boeremia exigua]